MVAKKNRQILFLILAILLIGIFIIGNSIDPEGLIDRIGTRNGYLVAFGVAFFAGFSALTTVSYYSMLIALIAGGLNPYLLVLITGISLTLGDIFLFYFGRQGRALISGKLDKKFVRISETIGQKNLQGYIPAFAWLYMGFIPLPNDWLLLFLASIKIPQRKMNWIIFFGDITHAGFATFLAQKGIIIFG